MQTTETHVDDWLDTPPIDEAERLAKAWLERFRSTYPPDQTIAEMVEFDRQKNEWRLDLWSTSHRGSETKMLQAEISRLQGIEREYKRVTTPSPTCPRCDGEKMVATPHGLVECPMCDGDGVIPEEYAQRLADGGLFYNERVSRSISLREEAAELGIDPKSLGNLEHGRHAPSGMSIADLDRLRIEKGRIPPSQLKCNSRGG